MAGLGSYLWIVPPHAVVLRSSKILSPAHAGPFLRRKTRKRQKIAHKHRHIAPPLHRHLAILKGWPSFDARLTNRHKLFHACFPHPAEVRQNALAFPHGLGGETIARSHHSRMIASHEPEAVHPCRYRGPAAGRFAAVAHARLAAQRYYATRWFG
jgi:hypothetical protein